MRTPWASMHLQAKRGAVGWTRSRMLSSLTSKSQDSRKIHFKVMPAKFSIQDSIVRKPVLEGRIVVLDWERGFGHVTPYFWLYKQGNEGHQQQSICTWSGPWQWIIRIWSSFSFLEVAHLYLGDRDPWPPELWEETLCCCEPPRDWHLLQ